MKENQLQQELSSIRDMMERSSKFISLSGLSGILAGIYALIGAAIGYSIINRPVPQGFVVSFFSILESIKYLLLIGVIVFVASIVTGLLLTYRKAKRNGQSVWGKTSRALLFNLCVPLLTGTLLMVIMIYKNGDNLIFLLPAMLIFYGLALVNASNFTFGDVKYLGLCEIALGLIAAVLPNYGLLFWALGFGVLHIIYGIIMYYKYDRESTI